MSIRKLVILLTIVAAGLLAAAVQAAAGAEAAEPEAEAGIGEGGMAATLLFLDLSELNRVLEANGYSPVSYTHLTLPTKRIV